MKKLIVAFLAVLVFSACQSADNTSSTTVSSGATEAESIPSIEESFPETENTLSESSDEKSEDEALSSSEAESKAHSENKTPQKTENSSSFSQESSTVNNEEASYLPSEFLSIRNKMLTFDRRYGYNSLNDKEKELYRRISNAAEKLSSSVSVLDLNLSSNRISDVYNIFLNDSPEIFFLSDRHVILSWDNRGPEILMLHYIDGEKIDKFDDRYENLIQSADREIIAKNAVKLANKVSEISLLVKFSLSEEEKIRFVHDFLVTETTYDANYANSMNDIPYEKLQSTSYGCLIEKNAVCSGITESASLILSVLGVENTVCYGKTEEMFHEWNIVKVGGNYYHLDITWDMNLKNGGSRWIGYEYYLLTDAKVSESRTIIWEGDPYEGFKSAPKPECSDDSLYIFNDIVSKNADEASLAAAIKAAAENETEYFIIAPSENLSQEELDDLAAKIYNSFAANIASSAYGSKISMENTYYIVDDCKILQGLIY